MAEGRAEGRTRKTGGCEKVVVVIMIRIIILLKVDTYVYNINRSAKQCKFGKICVEHRKGVINYTSL